MPRISFLWGWGDNEEGQLGNGTNHNSNIPVRATITASPFLKSISAGEKFSLVLLKDGTIQACGYNEFNQLGNGTNNNSNRFITVVGSVTPIPILTNVNMISAGYIHSLALLKDTTVRAWGDNDQGQLGDGTNDDSNRPVEVIGLSEVVAIAAGGNHSLALLRDGTVRAWGSNRYGQLGDGTNNASNSPIEVIGLNQVIAIAAGADHSLALLRTGTVYAWGLNSFGQLGNGTNISSNRPIRTVGLSRIVAIAGGGFGSLALMERGTVYAWGDNSFGQLGDGTESPSNTPLPIANLNQAIAIAAGDSHNLALLIDGTVHAWGNNQEGQLGSGTINARSHTPVQVTGLINVQAIAAGGSHSLAIVKDQRQSAILRRFRGREDWRRVRTPASFWTSEQSDRS